MIDYAAIVAKGVQLLDDKSCCPVPHSNYPVPSDWREKISGSKLDMANGDVCVLGQIFGTYSAGLKKLNLDDDTAKNYGFTTSTYNGGDFAELDKAWTSALGLGKSTKSVGDVYRDKYGYKAVVQGVVSLPLDGEQVDAVVYSLVGSSADDLFVAKEANFDKSYSSKEAAFQFEKGTFVTNDTGKVWFVVNSEVLREVKDQAYAENTGDVDTKSMRLLKTPAGADFGQYVGKRIKIND